MEHVNQTPQSIMEAALKSKLDAGQTTFVVKNWMELYKWHAAVKAGYKPTNLEQGQINLMVHKVGLAYERVSQSYPISRQMKDNETRCYAAMIELEDILDRKSSLKTRLEARKGGN